MLDTATADDAFAERDRAAERVGAAGRHAHHREAVDTQPVGQRRDVAGGVEDRPAFASVGAPEAGPVEGDQAHPERCRDVGRGREQP